MSRMMPRNLPLFASALALGSSMLLTGCQQLPPVKPYEQRVAEAMAPYEDLKAQKAELFRAGHKEQVFDFEGVGRVTVRRWELVGWPGDVYLQARIHYQNTTDEVKRDAWVWLDVLDSEGNVAGSTAVRLVNPVGYPFWPDHGYVTEIKARTNDAHLDPNGWSWALAAEATTESDPGVEPVIIDHQLEQQRAMINRARFNNWSPRIRGDLYAPGQAGPHIPGTTRW